MKFRVKTSLGLVVLSSGFLLFSGCGDHDEPKHPGAGGGAAASEGTFECQVIGELCHEAATGDGAAHDCHEQAHHGNGAECLESFTSCVSTCVPHEGEGAEKDPRCVALGKLCHVVDDEDGPLHECHELGHVNDSDICAASFDDCAERCLAAREALEDAGGAGAGSGAAGGHD